MMTESKIEEAYVKLCAMREETRDASVSLALIGSHEIRMLADPEVVPDGTPLFWLELFDHSMKTSVDSFRCYRLNDAALVFNDFVVHASELNKPSETS